MGGTKREGATTLETFKLLYIIVDEAKSKERLCSWPSQTCPFLTTFKPGISTNVVRPTGYAGPVNRNPSLLQAIEEKVRQLSNQHVVHPGLDTWKKAGYGRKAISIEEIPGVREAGWQPDPHSHSRIRLVNTAGDRPPTKSSLHAFMRSVLRVGWANGLWAGLLNPDVWRIKQSPVVGCGLSG